MMGDVNSNLLSKPLHSDAKHMKNIYDSAYNWAHKDNRQH